MWDVFATSDPNPPKQRGHIPLSPEDPEFLQQRYWRLPTKIGTVLATLIERFGFTNYVCKEIGLAQDIRDILSLSRRGLTVSKKYLSGRKEIVALFWEIKLGIDVDVCNLALYMILGYHDICNQDNYRIINFTVPEFLTVNVPLKTHVIFHDGPHGPTDRFLRMHFDRQCIRWHGYRRRRRARDRPLRGRSRYIRRDRLFRC
jgi:hypothetical protein